MEKFKKLSNELEKERHQNTMENSTKPFKQEKGEPGNIDLNSLMSGRYRKIS